MVPLLHSMSAGAAAGLLRVLLPVVEVLCETSLSSTLPCREGTLGLEETMVQIR